MPAWVVPAVLAAGGALINHFAQNRAYRKNMQQLREQNRYNDPASQMQRYQSAGLNPNLVYTQGNPGNQSSMVSYPEASAHIGTDAAASYNQSSVSQSQVAANTANVERTGALTEVAKLQAEVLRRNPYLNDDAFAAIIDGLKSIAKIKRSDVHLKENEEFYSDATKQTQASKIFREVELLEQRFKLGEADLKIKAEVLNSMEFRNAILEVQKKFAADGDIGPNQILQFITLLLNKAL